MATTFLYSLVGLGGAFGAMARFFIMGRFMPLSAATSFPLGILAVNLIGSLLMGLLIGAMAKWGQGGFASQSAHMLLAVGFLGGLTTFSSFALDVVTLIERGANLPALFYVATSVIGSVALLMVGLILMRGMHG